MLTDETIAARPVGDATESTRRTTALARGER